MNLVERAKIYACRAHKDQMYGNVPYAVHLSDVYVILHDAGIRDENLLAAAWMHDIIEDTAKTYSKVKKEFNETVAELVYCVTDELGRNRKERHSKTYPKIQKNPDAIIIKQADRLANIRTGAREGNDFLNMYKREYREFKEKLQPYGGIPELWNALDEILLPQEQSDA